MALGTYKVPSPFKDEDKWFRYFTKKQLLFVGLAAIAAIMLTVFFSKIHMPAIGVGIGAVLVIGIGALVFVTIPQDKYLIGGGYKLEEIALRVVIKHFPKNKRLYIKNYDDSEPLEVNK